MRLKPVSPISWWLKPFAWWQRRRYGSELQPMRFWGYRPKLFFLISAFFQTLDRKKSPIAAELRALVCLRVAQLHQCHFCIDLNQLKYAQRSTQLDKITALHQWPQHPEFNEQERAVLAYCETVIDIHRQVSDAQIAELRTWFDDAALMELTALISFQSLSASFNAALDVPAQGFCAIDAPNKSPRNTP
ncbi:hypothetical protein VST7929_00897 [Vibrio stylophorae]|uniref:Carboxymuconolactone decarboxylase family protein n=1 Tax=Vibrio stylophorae TaxID=659351 RepID=A0ABN8DPC1_9VIBR|nr:carboxymuconolactone decarboxylase family protein [Vibrio stylophorae]CAH0533046.1 hypothetical protein VST7929_00897 [Vibrio stylophorae]